MRFETGQHLRLGQHMKLAPKMIQSMEILQMSVAALEERIDQELERNIALETVEPDHDEGALAEERRERERDAKEGERELVPDAEGGATDFERLEEMSKNYSEAFDSDYAEYRKPRTRDDGGGDAKMEAMANTAARSKSLADQLLDQWSLVEIEPELRRAGEHLIAYIDDDGYIRTDLDTIADQAPPTIAREELDEALPLVQEWLEPPGIGARDLRECLLLQFDALEREAPEIDRSVERRLVADHLSDIESNRIPRIAQKTGLSIEAINEGLERLRSLDPRPGRRLAPSSNTPVIPDAIIEYDETRDEYVAALSDGRVPQLRVSPNYAEMAKDRSVEKKTREFVEGNVRDARWIIEAIEQRSSTLLRVVRAVIAHQRDFFDYGPQALKPLPMTQVADQLGVHVATVSRAVSGKWVETPRGVLPLRKFFTSGTETEEGEEVSWDAIKATLREIIENEDKAKPMGDEALSKALKERGISIARRTVAKYRDQLNIPPARLRKQY